MKLSHLIMKLYDGYCYLVDENVNALRHIPDRKSRYWVMGVLQNLWAVSVVVYMAAVILLGFSFLPHIALILAVCITYVIFFEAEKYGDSVLLKLRR